MRRAIDRPVFLRPQVVGLSAGGVRPLVLGVLKADCADLITAIGGQVVKLGRVLKRAVGGARGVCRARS